MTQRFKSDAFSLAILLGIYFISRCYNLLLLPMVFDEAIYLRWATIINAEPAKAMISAFDGKPPFFFMLNALTLEMFDDILFSSRIISVLAGALTVLMLYGIGSMLYSRRTAFLGCLIYVSLPFSLVQDRLGLVDSLLTTFVVATLGLSILLASYPEYYRSLSVALGTVLGLGFLTKTPHLIFWLFPLLAFLLLGNWRDRRLWEGLGLAAFCFMFLSAPYLFYEYPEGARSTKILHHNIDPWESVIQTLTLQNEAMIRHTKELGESILAYVTIPILFLFFLGTAKTISKRHRGGGLLLAWALIPPIPFLMIAEIVFSRYFLIAIPPMALLAAIGLEWIWDGMERTWSRIRQPALNGVLKGGSVMVALFSAWLWNVDYLTQPINARWTYTDRWQYISYEIGPIAVQDAVHFFKEEARHQEVYIFLTHKIGIPSDSLYLYLKDTPNITISDSWTGLDLPHALENATSIRLVKSKYEKSESIGTLSRDTLTGKEVYFVSGNYWYYPEEILKANPRLRIIRSYKGIDPPEVFSFNIYKMDPPLPPISRSVIMQAAPK